MSEPTASKTRAIITIKIGRYEIVLQQVLERAKGVKQVTELLMAFSKEESDSRCCHET